MLAVLSGGVFAQLRHEAAYQRLVGGSVHVDSALRQRDRQVRGIGLQLAPGGLLGSRDFLLRSVRTETVVAVGVSLNRGIPGMTMSPGFCPARHGPSHLASIVDDDSRIPCIGGS